MPLSPLSLNKTRPQARPSGRRTLDRSLALGILMAPAGLVLLSGQAFGSERIPTLEITITREGVSNGITHVESGLDSDPEAGANPEHPMLEFTLEESDTAIALFGCDCPHHLNQLRQLRGLPLLQEGIGI